MLSDAVRQTASQAIQARFALRDDVLKNELEQLAGKAIQLHDSEEIAKISVRLRLACEHDLFERAFIVWNNLKRAHEEHGGPKSATLLEDFLADARMFMKEASVNLANRLAEHVEEFGPIFTGPQALNAEWIAALRQRALERHHKEMEEHVRKVSSGFRNLMGG
ncbi:MAG: hypothetical protein QNJ40_23725 [Xanthomonadales bacterium]|nr:hypothetical protein [Xanthomonadales bacterium]